MAINITDFDKIWASSSPLTPYSFSDANYQEGWNFVGATPPARQMWDSYMKFSDEKQQYIVNNFLPLSGGTMTGAIIRNGNTVLGATDASLTRYCGGTNDNSGAGLTVAGKSHPWAGKFQLKAQDNTNSAILEGRPDGTLTWDNNDVWTSKVGTEQSPTLDTNNVLSNSVVTYQQVGKLVYVNVNTLRMSASATATYSGIDVASGFPTPAFVQRFNPLQVSDESAQPVPNISTNGHMYVATRGTSIANKVLIGGFVYIAQ